MGVAGLEGGKPVRRVAGGSDLDRRSWVALNDINVILLEAVKTA